MTDDWQPVPGSAGHLKRLEVSPGHWIYAAFTWIPTKWDNATGHPIQQEHWRLVAAFPLRSTPHD